MTLTADDFMALARSSPWRWSTLHFTHDGRANSFAGVEAWLSARGAAVRPGVGHDGCRTGGPLDVDRRWPMSEGPVRRVRRRLGTWTPKPGTSYPAAYDVALDVVTSVAVRSEAIGGDRPGLDFQVEIHEVDADLDAVLG